MKAFTIILAALMLAWLPASAQPAASSQGKYEAAGLKDQEVEQFFLSLKEAVAKENKAAVAAMVSYPIKLYLASGHHVTVRSKAAFVKEYDAIFDRAFKQFISQAKVEDLWAKSSGVATPGGEIWINGIIKDPDKPEQYEIKITAINGVTEPKK